ncbi:MAG: Zn-ribbon domain-containing OB-fold protein [Comamonas sp.]|nr:Zn-ribbon domain-containing OB-fold protein [Comamonas sp.]
MDSTLPKPISNADSQPYWQGARENKLLIRKCNACGQVHFMPRHVCPTCWSDDLQWIEASGKGTVHSYTIIRRASDPRFAHLVPYVVVLVDLQEGPRMMANVLGENALKTKIGDALTLVFEDRGDGDQLPQFQRVEV